MAKGYLEKIRDESSIFSRYTSMVYGKISGAYEGYGHDKWRKSIECINEHNSCGGLVNTVVSFECSSLFDEVSKVCLADGCRRTRE